MTRQRRVVQAAARHLFFTKFGAERLRAQYETGLLHLEVWSHANSAEGHHGSSSVVLLDQNRQLLFRSDPLNLGIAGKWDWTGQSDRNGTMEFHVPPEILREVVYGGVVQRNLGGSDLLAWLVSSEGAQTIGSIVQVIALLA